jgi:deoxyribodipyrimidine photolyase
VVAAPLIVGTRCGLALARLTACIAARPALDCLRRAVARTGASAVFWNRRYEPAAVARDLEVKKGLRAADLAVESSTYPAPIVDLAESRRAALAAYEAL